MEDAIKQVESTAPEERFSIRKVYIKDISFEVPNSPAVFAQEWKPEVQLEISNAVNVADESQVLYEVVLHITVTAKLQDKTAYLVEVHQAGLFTIEGFNNERSSYIVNVMCPTILFPFASTMVSNLVVQGGFQALLLSPINFEAMFMQQLQSRAQQENSAS